MPQPFDAYSVRPPGEQHHHLQLGKPLADAHPTALAEGKAHERM